MDEVGFRIPRVGLRIPGIGFRIPKAKKNVGFRNPDSLTWGEMLLCKFVCCYPIEGECHDHDSVVVHS